MKKMKNMFFAVWILLLFFACNSVCASAAEIPNTPITVACITQAPYLDPITEDGQIIGLFLFALEGLVTCAENDQGSVDIKPNLAENWNISDDGLIYTFTLKKDIKFYDGTPVTAEDWIWSILRLRDAGPESPWAPDVKYVSEVTAPNENTLVIKLSQPHAPFLANLAAPSAAVQSKKHYDKIGAEAYRKNPMGTGPYYFAEWELNQLYVLKKNPHYHVEGKYAPSEYRFVVVLDDNTRVMQLQAGQVDVVRDLPQNRIDEIAAYPGLAVDTAVATEQRYVNFNVTVPPFDNVKVRQALRLATNKEDIVKMVLFGHGAPAWNVFARVYKFYDDSIKDPGYDLEKAKALLAEAGYPNGFKTEIVYSSGNTALGNISTVLKEQWSQIGVDLQLNPMEGSTVSSMFQNLKHKITLLRWSTDTMDPAPFMSFVLNYDASHGFHTGWKNDHITEVAHKAESEVNLQKREAMYHEIQKALFEECPMFPIFRVVYPVARKQSVHNFNFTGLGRYDFADAYKSE